MMHKMLWLSSVLLAISTPVLAAESYLPQPTQSGSPPFATPGTATNVAPEDNSEGTQRIETVPVRKGAYIDIPLDPPLKPIGGGVSPMNEGMNTSGSGAIGIGR